MRRRAGTRRARRVQPLPKRAVAALRGDLGRRARRRPLPRWNADPEDVQRAVLRLVVALVEFLRRLLERQAIRRMEAGTLTPDEIEAVGRALLELERTVRSLARRFDLSPEDLDLDLGPLGRLM